MVLAEGIVRKARITILFLLSITFLAIMDAGSSILGGYVSRIYKFRHFFTVNVVYWLSIGILALICVPLLTRVADRGLPWWLMGILIIVGFVPAYVVYVITFIALDRAVLFLLGPLYSLCCSVMSGNHMKSFDFFFFLKYLGTSNFSSLMCAYLAIVGASYTYRYLRISRQKEIRASQLEAGLARAILQTLTVQLQPHFLFNTLNAISCLVHTDPESADRMIGRLARFLRMTLEQKEPQCIPLRKELEYLDLFLDIELTRFRERLSVVRQIQAEALDIAVPFLILQPLVENALRHGIARMPGECVLCIEATIRSGRLILAVSDDGAGLPEGWTEGMGLTNCRERLRQLYGGKAAFRIEELASGGVRAEVEIPALALERRDQTEEKLQPSGAAGGSP